jgi:XRE family transcriptional regulator, regulator of sulfur utilization
VAGPSPTSAELGAAIRELREARGPTIEALALAAGVDPSYLSGIERGRRNPTWEKLRPIFEALGVETSTVVEIAERISREQGANGVRPKP